MAQLPGLIDRADAGTLTEREAFEYSSWLTNLEQAAILLPVLAAIAFLMWLHRTATNVRPITGESPRFSPAWSVGWWFIPVAFLVMPFLVVRDLFRRLAAPGSHSWLVAAWWIAFAGGSVGSRVGGQLMEQATTDADFSAAVVVGVAGMVAAGLAALPAVMIIRAIEQGSVALSSGMPVASAGTESQARAVAPGEWQCSSCFRLNVPAVATCAGPSCAGRRSDAIATA